MLKNEYSFARNDYSFVRNEYSFARNFMVNIISYLNFPQGKELYFPIYFNKKESIVLNNIEGLN